MLLEFARYATDKLHRYNAFYLHNTLFPSEELVLEKMGDKAVLVRRVAVREYGKYLSQADDEKVALYLSSLNTLTPAARNECLHNAPSHPLVQEYCA